MFYDNFVALCASVNKTPAYVGRELGIDKSTISCWKARKTKPSDVNAQKIADYFGITVEELMSDDPSAGIKKDPIPKDGAVSEPKQKLRDLIDGLPDEQCEKLAGFIAEALKLM
nr:MAG TPA: helix-turn-helix domain protein [Bacteriophage sp.]